MGAQKNCLIERDLLSTHNICFGWEIKMSNFQIDTKNYQHPNPEQRSLEIWCEKDKPTELNPGAGKLSAV